MKQGVSALSIYWEDFMKITGTMLFVCITLALLGIGCSKDDASTKPEHPIVVRKAIKKSKPQPPRPAPPVGKPEVKPTPEPKPSKTVTPQPQPAVKPEPVTPQQARVKPVQPAKPTPQTPVTKEEEGVYVVRQAETLLQIAGRKEVYGDPLKWPILYFTNRSALSTIGVKADSITKALPLGTRLKIITAKQVQKNMKAMPSEVWAINVLSIKANQNLLSRAFTLLNNKYPVYITLVNVKGVDWLRLRVGFFPDRNTANVEGKKIVKLLHIHDSWVATVGKQELAEYGGYLTLWK
jgi:hypothetical protein